MNNELSAERLKESFIKSALIFKNETKKEFEHKLQLAEKISLEVNPYEPLPLNVKEVLFFLGIVDFSNPFNITNELLILMEELKEKINECN